VLIRPENEFQEKLLQAMQDDLNISKANAIIDNWISEASARIKSEQTPEFQQEMESNFNFIESLLGIGGMDPDEYFRIGFTDEDCDRIEKHLVQRQIYKKTKQYEKADEIRDYLMEMGVNIIDSRDGTKWEGTRLGPDTRRIKKYSTEGDSVTFCIYL